jgi:hypothetical protein
MAVYILTAAQLRGAGILNSFIIPSSSTPPTPTFDADAQAFITAAAITDPTQQTAINTLVVSMKGYGVWTKMKALYPMVGGTASQHKFNLKNPLDTNAAFRLVFNGGWTHSSTGALPNGINSWADTFFSPSMYSALTNASAGVYLRTNTALNGVDLGQGLASVAREGVHIYPRYIGDAYYSCCLGSNFNTGANSDSRGFFHTTRTGTSQSFRKRGATIIDSSITNTTTVGTTSLGTIFLGAANEFSNGKNPSIYSNREQALAYIGDYISQTEIDNYYTAVQAFQTTLGRQV